jgi:hypothetical protein
MGKAMSLTILGLRQTAKRPLIRLGVVAGLAMVTVATASAGSVSHRIGAMSSRPPATNGMAIPQQTPVTLAWGGLAGTQLNPIPTHPTLTVKLDNQSSSTETLAANLFILSASGGPTAAAMNAINSDGAALSTSDFTGLLWTWSVANTGTPDEMAVPGKQTSALILDWPQVSQSGEALPGGTYVAWATVSVDGATTATAQAELSLP